MRARVRGVIAVGALIAATVPAACGGGDEPPAVSPPVSVTSTTPTIQTTTVRTDTVAGDADAGRTIFEQSCQTCHPAGGAEAGAGPKLAEAGFTADQIRRQIVSPRQSMPPNLVGGTELDDVTAYLVGLQ